MRAAREAECRKYRDTPPFNNQDLAIFRYLKDKCVKRAAMRATRAIYPDEGAACVAAAFDAAVLDLSPSPSPPEVALTPADTTTPAATPAALSPSPGPRFDLGSELLRTIARVGPLSEEFENSPRVPGPPGSKSRQDQIF